MAIAGSHAVPRAAESPAPGRREIGSRTRAPAGWIERLVVSPTDGEETTRRKVRLVVASVLVVPAGVIWGALYFAFGERLSAAFPLGYSALTLLDLLLLVRSHRYSLFRWIQQSLLFALPFALQLSLGGFVGSSVVILWSFLAVVMALLFGGTREALVWFGAYVLTVLAAAAFQPHLAIENSLPPGLVAAFFVLNIVTVCSLAFVVLHSFLSDRRRLRELELAYLNQELVLRQSEKLATLGTLAAGVAHELNNPAAAARRASGQLRDALAHLESARLRLGAVTITPEGAEILRELAEMARSRAHEPDNLGTVERSDREAAIEQWCEEHGIDEPWAIASALAAHGFDPAALDRLAARFEGEALHSVLSWAAALFPVHGLVHEIGEGAARVSEIVGALRGYSYLGQAPVQAVDLHEGIDNTLVILRNKLKAGIQVRREYEADVPRVWACGGELNQVWTNLLDNAADAMGGKGEIAIRTRRQDGWAVVEIEDNGPGIPEEIQPRIFDPFFTTKEPGKGTGLGLSTSHAIIAQRHKGQIRVESRPGCTRFTIRLPLEAPEVPECRS